MLPPPEQSWSHSTCSIDTLQRALGDDEITAIESDILMGTVIPSPAGESTTESTSQPIMAHPPDTSSDLSFEKFMELSMDGNEHLKKHLKLDMKEEECIDPILQTLRKRTIGKDTPRIIYFNADILLGPAMRNAKCIKANNFIEKCLKFIQEDGNPQNFAFSLGWKTDCRSFFGYTASDAGAMVQLMERYQLSEKSSGVVLAVNARVLAKRVGSFDKLLEDFPSCQLLVWTGTGEPAISSILFNHLKSHYETMGFSDRVGYDCQVSTYHDVHFHALDNAVLDSALCTICWIGEGGIESSERDIC